MQRTIIFLTRLLVSGVAGPWLFAQTNFGQQTNGPLGATINTVAVNPTNGNVFAAVQGAGVIGSTNKGTSWSMVNTGLTNFDIRILRIGSNEHIFAGTREGLFRLRGSGFWNKIFEADVRVLGINQTTDALFAGTSGGIFRSKDNGEFGTLVNSLPDNFTFVLVLNAQGHIFAGTQKGGVLRSTDNGVTWSAFNSGLPATSVTALAANVRGAMFAGTSGNGVFSSQSTTSIKESGSEIPTAFKLAQNYPNPFNPSTMIKYELPQAGEVQLTIYDLNGQRVRTLVQQQQPAGQYEVIWDGRNEEGEAVASGLYNYQLRAMPSTGSGFVQARRMALVR